LTSELKPLVAITATNPYGLHAGAMVEMDRCSRSGALGRPAAKADKNEDGRAARLGSLNDRWCREAGCLDPAGGKDRNADEAVLIVQVDRQRDVLPVMGEQVAGELGCRGGIVDPPREVQLSVRHRIGAADAGPPA
jgi:hypothetical protein